MICIRCKMVVRYELEKLGINLLVVRAGQVEILEPISKQQLASFKQALIEADLELVDTRKNVLIEKIVNVISEMIDHPVLAVKNNFSYYLSKKLNRDYTYMANVFSESQGITLEHFVIENKIRKVKQLICHNDLNLTEISRQLNYSSVAHLSTQFKKVTGVTPSHFKLLAGNNMLQSQMCEL